MIAAILAAVLVAQAPTPREAGSPPAPTPPPGEARREPPATPPPTKGSSAEDEEIVRNLELLEKLELLRRMELFDPRGDDDRAPGGEKR